MRKFLVTSVAAALLATGMTAPAQSDTVSISKTFSGFTFEKPSLTLDMRTQIKAWLEANSGFTSVSCFGYTGHNVFNRTAAFMKTLAVTRAKNTCNYVRKLATGLKLDSVSGIPSPSRNPSSRRVTITLSKEGTSIGNGGTGDGSGTGVTGTCDDQVFIKMKSRLLHADLYFSEMAITDISANCNGKKLDAYLVDADGNQLAVAMDRPISGTSLTLGYSLFTPNEVKTTTVNSVAISIHG